MRLSRPSMFHVERPLFSEAESAKQRIEQFLDSCSARNLVDRGPVTFIGSLVVAIIGAVLILFAMRTASTSRA